MTRQELLALSNDRNVKAMLNVISLCEGTSGADGYRTLFGGSLFESFEAHPNKKITAKMRGTPITSTAAGKYQFIFKTWSGLVQKYGFPDFSPAWQDAGAVALIVGRKALQLVMSGRIGEAVEKLRFEWASLPGAPYNQPTKTNTFVTSNFKKFGGILYTEPSPDAQAAPIENRTLPPSSASVQQPFISQPVEPNQESPMLPAVAVALLPSLIELIPEIGKLFGDGPKTERNTKVIEKVAEVVVAATGAPNLQGAVEDMKSDPEALEKARDAIRREWFEIQERATAAAHDRMLKYNAQTEIRTIWLGLTFIEWLSAWLVVTGTAAGAYVLVKGEQQFGNQIIGMVVTLLVIGGVVGVREFWLGTSSESRRKTDMLLDRERQP